MERGDYGQLYLHSLLGHITPRTSMKHSSNYFVLLFGVFMLAGLLLLAWIGSPKTVTAVGEELPTLDLQPLVATDEIPTVEGLKGKIAVLHFWGVWSPESVRGYPGFVRLAKRFEDAPDVKVFSVISSAGPDFDLDGLRQSAQEFMESVEAPLPTHADPAAMTRGKLALLFPNGTFGYPTTILVDRDGVIVATERSDMQRLSEQIESLR